jgi:hypothetical protein
MEDSLRAAIYVLVALWLSAIVVWAIPRPQQAPALEQRQTIERAFATFADCVMHQDIQCVTASVSDRGMNLGVDGARIAKRKLPTETGHRRIDPVLLLG